MDSANNLLLLRIVNMIRYLFSKNSLIISLLPLQLQLYVLFFTINSSGLSAKSVWFTFDRTKSLLAIIIDACNHLTIGSKKETPNHRTRISSSNRTGRSFFWCFKSKWRCSYILKLYLVVKMFYKLMFDVSKIKYL